MKRKRHSTFMLLIGVILLAGFIWFIERSSEGSYHQQARTRTVFTVYPGTIERILFERDGVQIECEKIDGAWRLIRPTDAPVNETIVNKMVAGMARVERGEVITTDVLKNRGLTPADYGFDEPRAKITFRNNMGTFTWLIGRDAPLGENLYLMSADGGDIIAASQDLLNLIPTDPAWIRDRTLFFGEAAAVRGLDLHRPAGFLQLRQPEHNGWQMQQPVAARTDMTATHALIGTLFDSKITSFVTDEKIDLTGYGLQEPAYQVTIFMQDEQVQTLHIGKPLPDTPEVRYAKRADDDSIFTVSAEWTRTLDIGSLELRDRLVLGFPAERITALQINRNGDTVELTKTNRQWTVTRPARWNAEPAHVEEILQSLTQATVETFIDNPSTNQTEQLQSARWKILVTANGETQTLNITEPQNEATRLVQYEEENALYETAPGIVRKSFANPLFYRNLTVLKIDPAQIKKISVRTASGEQEVEQTDDGIFIASDRALHVENKALNDLLFVLNTLRASQYSAFNPETLEPYGLDTPEVEISVALNATDVIGRILRLGKKTPDGQYAMLQGQDIVFMISEENAAILTRKLTRALETPSSEIAQP